MSDLISRRNMVSLSLLFAAFGTPGCFGSFTATNKLWKFNDGISDSKWIKWLFFLGLAIVPVYSLFILGDALIFNTVEFYTGKNPLLAGVREFGDGSRLAFARDQKDHDVVRVEHRRDGVVAAFYVKRTGDHFTVLDEQRVVLATTRDDGERVMVVDGRGRVLTELSAADVKRYTSSIEKTGSAVQALREVVDRSQATRTAQAAAAPRF